MKRAYYTAVFCGLYGTAGLALALCACSGCGSGARRLPGDRAPSLIVTAPVAELPVAPPTPPGLTPEPAPRALPGGAVILPVGPPIAGPARDGE